jgi:hypothetical protein
MLLSTLELAILTTARLATLKEQGRQGFGEDTTQKMPRRLYTSCKERYLTNNTFFRPQATILPTF